MPTHPLANALSGARLTRLPYRWSPSDGPVDHAEAYLVQAEVSGLVGAQPVGWKTGFDPDRVPIAGPILACDLCENGGTYRLAPGEEVIVEVEMAIRLGQDLAPGHQYTVEDIVAVTQSIHVAIELVGTRYADFDATPFPAKLADNLNHGAFVAGECRTDVAAVPRNGLPLSLRIDGEIVAEHPAVHGDGEPLAAVAAWAAAQPDRLGGLRKGHFITTGSLNKVLRMSRPARIEAQIEGIGQASLSLL